MKYYQEIAILPDNEISPYFIWQKVFMQIHLALADNRTENDESEIGISFPDYDLSKNSLGLKMRLFAKDSAVLRIINIHQWLERLVDYSSVSEIRDVPASANKYARYERFRPVTNKARLARRRAQRHNESFEEALSHYERFNDQQSKLPFINMGSLSNDNRFRLFIKKKFAPAPIDGTFSCYGLSSHATVPDF